MRVGVIGLGSMGQNHYRVLNSIPFIEAVVVADPREDVLPEEHAYTSTSRMLETEKLDAVIVAVPTTAHLDVAVSVLERGIPMLLEKPVASTLEEANVIRQRVETSRIPVAVGHVERFNPVVRSLMSELAGKRIYSITITRIGPFPPRIADVGVLVDLSVHDIDLVHWLTRHVPVAEARIFKSVKGAGSHEDNAVVTLRLENDVVASIVTNWLTPFKRRTIEVATDQAFYQADLMSQELTEYSAYQDNNSYLVRNCTVTKGEPLRKELEAFLRFVQTGERDGLADVEEGLVPLRIISRARGVSAVSCSAP